MKLETYDRNAPLMIVGQLKSIPRMKIMKTKWTKITTSSRKTLTCETSGNIKRVYVNLMPILAAAREPEEEEEGTDEEDEGSARENKTQTSRKNQPSLIAREQVSSSEVELPPIPVHKAAALQSDGQSSAGPRTTLPPIRPSNWVKSSKPTGELPHSKPATEEPAFPVRKKAIQNFLITQMQLQRL